MTDFRILKLPSPSFYCSTAVPEDTPVFTEDQMRAVIEGAAIAERERVVELIRGRACHHNGPHLLTLELNQLANVVKSGMGWLEYERTKYKGAQHG